MSVEQISKSEIAKSFGHAAEKYDSVAHFQRNVGHDLLEKMPNHAPECIVDLGCGTGYFLSSLSAMYPNAALVGFDLSQDMIRFALHLHYRDLNQAKQVMYAIDSKKFYVLPQALQARYYQNKIVLLEQLNRPIQAMRIRISKADLLYPDKNTAHSAILSHLFRLNIDEMRQGLSQSRTGSIEQGWYALTSDLSKNLWNISLQQQGLRHWLDQWRQHPASFVLPDYVAKLLQQKAKPVHIALVLPFSGPLALKKEANSPCASKTERKNCV